MLLKHYLIPNNVYYLLGKRDAVAEILLMVRVLGERKALLMVANQLINSDKETVFYNARWYADNHEPTSEEKPCHPES